MVKGDGRQHQQQSFWDPHGTRGGEIFGSEQGRRLNWQILKTVVGIPLPPNGWLMTACWQLGSKGGQITGQLLMRSFAVEWRGKEAFIVGKHLSLVQIVTGATEFWLVVQGGNVWEFYLWALWIEEVAGVGNHVFISVSKSSPTRGDKSRKIFIKCPKRQEGGGEELAFSSWFTTRSQSSVALRRKNPLPGGKCRRRSAFWAFAFAFGAAPALLSGPVAHRPLAVCCLSSRCCSPSPTSDYLEIIWLSISRPWPFSTWWADGLAGS